MSNVKSSIAAKNKQGIHFQSFYAFDDFIGDINRYLFAIADHLTCIGIAAIGRTQNCAPAWQDPTYAFNAKWHDSFFVYEPIVTIAYPQDFTTIFINGGLHHGTYHSIEPGRVATAREDTYSLHELSPG